jgi:hypothetical protein
MPTLYLYFVFIGEETAISSPIQHKLIGVYNRDEKCLQRGTDWALKYSSLRFVYKG